MMPSHCARRTLTKGDMRLLSLIFSFRFVHRLRKWFSEIGVLLAQLDEVDYIIESSNRLYGSIPRMPAEYPSTVAYYEALFNEQLGFTKIVSFENKPSLLVLIFPHGGLKKRSLYTITLLLRFGRSQMIGTLRKHVEF